jgi:serine/threonine protein kinase
MTKSFAWLQHVIIDVCVMHCQEIRNPPKGFRSFRLKTDPHIMDSQAVPITGFISIQLNRTVTHKKNEIRHHYKLQIKKLTGLYAVQNEKLSNPYCEISWKGEVEKVVASIVDIDKPETDVNEDIPIEYTAENEQSTKLKKKKPKKATTEVFLIKDYTVIGQTATMNHVTECEYDREDNDGSVLELPPIWTDNPIKGRGVHETDVATRGGYVSKNQIPEASSQQEENQQIEGKILLSANAETPLEEIQRYREHIQRNELLAVEKKLLMEVYRYTYQAEEKERCYMGRAEAEQRECDWQREKELYQGDLKVQEQYARSFQRLLELLIFPSPIVTRLRFLMGEETESDELNFNHTTLLFQLANTGENVFKSDLELPGSKSTLSRKQLPMNNSIKVRCEDPATSQIVNVVCTPMTNTNDERDMQNQVLRLVGKLAPNLVKVIDFAIHQLRSSNAQGFTAIYERLAVVVMEYVDGISMHQYLIQCGDAITNDSFRELLLQLVQGIGDLHDEGVVHRNISPQEVLVQLEESSLAKLSYKNVGNNQPKASGSIRPIVRIGGYWFLENPRVVDCQISHGRADWGNRMTAPPESLNHSFEEHLKPSVTEKSDIYALGVCVFYWATNGLLLPPEFKSSHNIEIIKPLLPQKWGNWVFSLLRMCLSLYPHRRASAKEIVLFLQNRLGKKS